MFHEMNDMESDVKRWIEKDGEAFLKDIRIKKGQTILDFGCSVGNYTLPAAKLVGESGRVFALDKNEETLDELMKRIEKKS
jgi:ubiquinone/menaquinone biosynthesis C-methylase UbiE